jgi:O-antigen/teichoic acid export membrane protein
MGKLLSLFFKNTTFKQIFLKNTFWTTFSEVVSRGMKFLLIPFAARVLGPEQFGILNYTYSLVLLYFLFSDFGIGLLFVREYQKESSEEDLLSTMFYCKMFFIVLGLIASFVAVIFVKDPLVFSIYFIYLGVALINQLKGLLITLCGAMLRFEYFSVVNMVESAIVTGLGCLILVYSPTLMNYASVYLIGASIGLWLLLSMVKNDLPRYTAFDFKHVKRILVWSFPFLATTLVSVLLLTSDVLMIKWIRGAEEVGYYQAALKLFQISTIFGGHIVGPFYAILSKVHNDHDRLVVMLRQGLSVLIMVGLPLSVGGFLLGEQLILDIFTDLYAQSGFAFRLMIVSAVVMFPLNLLNLLMVVVDKQVKNMFITGVSTVVNIVANLILIPFFGFIGAVIGTFIARIFDFVWTYFYCKKVLGPRSFFHLRSLVTYCIASLIMSGSIFMSQMWLNMSVVSVVVGVVTYCLCLVAFKDVHFVRLYSLLIKHKVFGGGR